jgi:hypothetical protein
MRHIKQPKESSLCGQACVAMILGCDLRVAQKLVGRNGATRTSHLVRALRLASVEVADKLKPWCGGALPFTAILRIKFRKRVLGHWVLKHGDQIFDPMKEGARLMRPGLWRRRRGWIASYLELKPPHRPGRRLR